MSWVRSLLEILLGPFDLMLGALPLASARWFAVLLLLVPAAVVALSSRTAAVRGAPDAAWYRDLRLWAVLFTLPYLLVYLLV